MKYSWRTPMFSQLNAEQCAIELERIREEHDGIIEPEAVVERAKDPLSPLHRGFTWDDSVAAAAHRRDQARALVRSISIVIEKEDRPEYQRIYVNVQSSEQKGYMPIALVSEYADLSAAVLKKAASDLQSWIDRYKDLRSRLPGAFRNVEIVLDEIKEESARLG